MNGYAPEYVGGFVYVTFKRPKKISSETTKVNSGDSVAPTTLESKGESKIEDLKSSPETARVHQKTDNGSPESSLETIISSPEFINSSSEQKVISILKADNRMTLDKIAQHLNMTKRGVQKITNRLQQSGLLSRKGSTKAGEWIVNDTKTN